MSDKQYPLRAKSIRRGLTAIGKRSSSCRRVVFASTENPHLMRSVPDAARFPQGVERAGPWPPRACRAALPRRCLLGCLFLATVLIAGCAQAPNKSDDELANAAPAALAPLFAFLATAAASEPGIVEDPRTGANVWVIADRAYNAASGRLCRRFYVVSPQSYEGMTEGLACRDERGHWTASELLINRDELGAPRLRYP